jgi:2-deoxy-D-gluconate 3-dehydrogenase
MGTWGPFGLDGKRAVVTGGAMGIGFGIAACFAEAGADVLIADLDAGGAATAADKLTGMPGNVAWVQCDVSADDAGARLVEAAVAQLGGLDVLVNNAGIYPTVPVLDMPADLLDRVYRVNLRGLILISKAAGAHFVAHGVAGRIVNIASIDSLRPSMVGLAAYDASKGGVLMFTRNFALEMAPHGVLVNAIAPGGIATEGMSQPLAENMTPEEQAAIMEAFIERVPLRRVGAPTDIGTVAVFLASPASGYMTGQLVVVDGGALLL